MSDERGIGISIIKQIPTGVCASTFLGKVQILRIDVILYTNLYVD